jgi:hypothetical protein
VTQHALITPHNQEFRITPRCALRYIQAAGSSVRRQPATMSVLPTVVPPPHTIECFLPPPHTIQYFPLSLSRFTITGFLGWNSTQPPIVGYQTQPSICLRICARVTPPRGSEAKKQFLSPLGILLREIARTRRNVIEPGRDKRA